jgi:hypothetical protein
VTILHEEGGNWTQITPTSGESPLDDAHLEGSPTDAGTSQSSPVGGSIAPVPGTKSAWISLSGREGAKVVRVEAPHTGPAGEKLPATLLEEATLPRDEAHPIGNRGRAGPIACPAENDCWMATNEGWLFHLSDGAAYPQDTDPNFAGVITYRPPDASVPVVYPDAPPVDDSLANQEPPPAPTGPPEQAPATPPKRGKAKPLLLRVKSKFVDHHILVISFTLTARAHVQLVGRRKRKVVAETRDESLHAGRHTLSLSLEPAHWPTKLQFKATPAGGGTPSGGEAAGGAGGSDTIGT